MPKQTEALIHTIRLRWLAKKVGFERLVLRNDHLTAYFVNNPESPYYQSSQFTGILEFLKTNPTYCKLKEEKQRLLLIFKEVSSIDRALELLQKLDKSY